MADLNVFVFPCADTDLQALTLYRCGDNYLPAGACPGCWRCRGGLLLNPWSAESSAAPSTGGAPHSYPMRVARGALRECEKDMRSDGRETTLRYAHRRGTNAHSPKSPPGPGWPQVPFLTVALKQRTATNLRRAQ